MDESTPAPSFLRRHRGWFVAAGVLVLLVGALLWKRQHGLDVLVAELAAHRAAGFPVTVADLAAASGPVDADRQARFEGAFSRPGRLEIPASAMPALEAWLTRHADSFPDAPLETLAARAASADRLRTALGGDGVFLGLRGAVARLGPGEDVPWPRSAKLLGSSLMEVLAWGQEFRWHALLDADPGPWLDALDGLYAALDRPACLLDALVANVFDADRDRAYLELACRGTLPPAARDRWLAESPRGLRLAVDGLRGESAVIAGPLAEAMLAGDADLSLFAGASGAGGLLGFGKRGPRIGWLHGPVDLARVLESQRQMVDVMERGTGIAGAADALTTEAQETGGLLEMMSANYRAVAVGAMQSDARHRMTRAAARIVAVLDDTGALPETADGFDAAVRAALDGSPPLRYTRFGPRRFRLEVPYDAGPEEWRALMTHMAPPDRPAPSARPLVIEHQMVEIEIAE